MRVKGITEQMNIVSHSTFKASQMQPKIWAGNGYRFECDPTLGVRTM